MKAHHLIVITVSALWSCSEQTAERKAQTDSALSARDRCTLVPDQGPCKALLKRYYYDKTESKCKEFIWGGCNGVVPFETITEC
jgi:hypothetical protein